MTIRVVAGLAAALILAACDETSNPLLGSWQCETQVQGQKATGTVNYASDGKSSGTLSVAGNDQNMMINMRLTYTGSWKLRDDQLEEKIDDLHASADIGGISIPQDDLAPMIASMKGQGTTSTVAVSKNLLTLRNLGDTTSCTR